MKVISLETYKKKKREESTIRIGDHIQWHDPIFQERRSGKVEEIVINPGLSEYMTSEVVVGSCRFWLVLDNFQSIDGSLFEKKL